MITSKEFTRIGTVKQFDSGFACENFKCIKNKLRNGNPTNWLRRKDKDIQQLLSWRNMTQLNKLDFKESINFTKKVECICVFNNQSTSNFYYCYLLE